MFNEKVLKSLEFLVGHGINVSIEFDKDSCNWVADLNTKAKSGMHLEDDGEAITIKMRYGDSEVIFYKNLNSIDLVKEYCKCFVRCIHGRDFYSAEWKDLSKSFGINVD